MYSLAETNIVLYYCMWIKYTVASFYEFFANCFPERHNFVFLIACAFNPFQHASHHLWLSFSSSSPRLNSHLLGTGSLLQYKARFRTSKIADSWGYVGSLHGLYFLSVLMFSWFFFFFVEILDCSWRSG